MTIKIVSKVGKLAPMYKKFQSLSSLRTRSVNDPWEGTKEKEEKQRRGDSGLKTEGEKRPRRVNH